jgi:eukaryotic-like serine/threonine-protein kinase
VILRAGLTLNQRFRLVEPISLGGSGGAWRAVDEVAGHDVAVKALPSHMARDAAAKASFQLASRSVAALSYPGVAQVRQCGQVMLSAGPTIPYLVRDLITGPTLAERLSGGALPAGEALAIVASVADILAATHRAGLAHGHLVPENVLLSPDGVKVSDFGLWATSEHPDLALVPGLAPYACYTAPEQRGGGPATPATDMYSLGALFTACLTGLTCGQSARAATVSGIAAGPRTGAPGPSDVAGRRSGGVSTLVALAAASVGASVASLWAACLAASPGVRPSAAHAAVMSRQIIVPDPLATAMGAITAASSRWAGTPAVPAAG